MAAFETTVQLYNCTAVQLYNCTTVQLYNCTGPQGPWPLLPLAPSFARPLPLTLLLGRTSPDPSYNNLFSATSLGSSLLFSGHHCSLLSLPSFLSGPLAWPRLHLARARLALSPRGEKRLARSLLERIERRERSEVRRERRCARQLATAERKLEVVHRGPG